MLHFPFPKKILPLKFKAFLVIPQLFLIGSLIANFSLAADTPPRIPTETLKMWFESKIGEYEEMALQGIINGSGDGSLLPEIEAVVRRHAQWEGNRTKDSTDFSANIIREAVAAIKQISETPRYRTQAYQSLLTILAVSTDRESITSIKEALPKDPNELREIIKNILTNYPTVIQLQDLIAVSNLLTLPHDSVEQIIGAAISEVELGKESSERLHLLFQIQEFLGGKSKTPQISSNGAAVLTQRLLKASLRYLATPQYSDNTTTSPTVETIDLALAGTAQAESELLSHPALISPRHLQLDDFIKIATLALNRNQSLPVKSETRKQLIRSLQLAYSKVRHAIGRLETIHLLNLIRIARGKNFRNPSERDVALDHIEALCRIIEANHSPDEIPSTKFQLEFVALEISLKSLELHERTEQIHTLKEVIKINPLPAFIQLAFNTIFKNLEILAPERCDSFFRNFGEE